MPRYAITTVFNEAELKRIEETARMLGFTKYRLMREATIKYCEDCLKHDRESRGESQRQDTPRISRIEVRTSENEDI